MIDISIKQVRGNTVQFDYRFENTRCERSPLGVFLAKEIEALKQRTKAFVEQGEVVRQAEGLVDKVSDPATHATLTELRDLLAKAKETGDTVDLGRIRELRQKLLDSGIQTTPREHFAKKDHAPAPVRDEGFTAEGVKITGGKFDSGSKEPSDAEVQQVAEQSRWKRKQEALAGLPKVSPEEIIMAGKKKPGRKKAPVGDPYQ